MLGVNAQARPEPAVKALRNGCPAVQNFSERVKLGEVSVNLPIMRIAK